MPRWIFKLVTWLHNTIFRLTGGRIGSNLFGVPALMLTVRGRKSGRLLTFPLCYIEDGGDWIIVASKGGDPKHPDWYLNLVANPQARIELRGRSVAVLAETVSAEEKARLWPRVVAVYPPYESYQKRAGTRDIPLVRLRPSAGTTASGHQAG